MHIHAGAIRQLLNGCANVREIIHSLKLLDYLPVHTHKPYNNLHIKVITVSISGINCGHPNIGNGTARILSHTFYAGMALIE